ncbi:hypothetical protein HYS93_01230 [Candidatus Daviesbacteria bacterium]|nr:hypothetical protein [Candidatus Daviesbacteria bacterium]
MKSKIIIGAVLLIIIFLMALSMTLVKPKPKAKPSPSPSPKGVSLVGNDKLNKLARFKLNKYKLLPLLKVDATPSAVINDNNQDQALPATRSYQIEKAKVTYLPLPDLFEGSVENAKTIEEYRLAKKQVVLDLRNQGINVCDLNIYWVRPKDVPIKDLQLEDIKSDGC